MDSLEALGVPGLLGCKSLTVSGPVSFSPGVIIEGDVEVRNPASERKVVPAGIYRDQKLEL